MKTVAQFVRVCTGGGNFHVKSEINESWVTLGFEAF